MTFSCRLTQHPYHVDDHLPECLALLRVEAVQYITVLLLEQQPERDSQVVVLEHGLVVVHERELRAGVDEVLVRQSGMVRVVDGGREQSREDLERREHGLEMWKRFTAV